MYKIYIPSSINIAHAVSALKAGELVAFPTETVYGLGADANNTQAIKKVFSAKRRPADHPLIVHIASLDQLSLWVKNIPEVVNILATHFWPGPLTLILPVAAHVSPLITAGQNTIAIRMPSHPVARQLLMAFGSGMVAPSANRFGRISPTTAQHVAEELGDKITYVLDGGACEWGLESTIIDVTRTPSRLLRPGPLTPEKIAQTSGVVVMANEQNNQGPRTSGSHLSHYAPQTPLHLCSYAQLKERIPHCPTAAVMSFQSAPPNFLGIWQQMSLQPEMYAHDLYAVLRAMDAKNAPVILLELPPMTPSWQAIHDRLQRAAFSWR